MDSVSVLCRSCGFNDLLTKPANLVTLQGTLDRYLSLPQGQSSSGKPTEPPVMRLALDDTELQFRRGYYQKAAAHIRFIRSG